MLACVCSRMLTWIDSELGQAVEAVQRAEFPADFAEADAAAVRRRGKKKREGGTLFKVAARFSEEEELTRRKEEGVAGVAEDVLWCQRESEKLGGVEGGSVSERGSGGGGFTLLREGERGQARILHLGFHEGVRKEIDLLSCMLGTQFTCFTGTKIQILTQKRYAARSANRL